jgi:phosphoribosyl-dephospho-CoA transferase
LPPALGKRRLAFQVSRADIARCAPPPALTAAVIGELPPDWRALALRLLGLQEILATGPRILGSAAMQLTTGLPCLGPDSDLDLLLSPCDAADAHIVCRVLAALDERPCQPRVDGEIRNAAGEAVAWREFASDSRQVLVKSFHGVRLAGREDFISGFRQRAGAFA